MILNQWSRSNCWIYATIAILIHKWVNFDIAKFSEQKAPYIPLIEKLFKDSGLIDKFVQLKTPTVVDMWLKKWEYILTWSPRWNFDNPPNITFDWNTQHWFVICEDLWDRWKCINSWGEEWGDKWYFYIKKSDFKRLFTPNRIVISTK